MVEKGEIAPDDITSSFFASIFVKVSFKTNNLLTDINLLDFDSRDLKALNILQSLSLKMRPLLCYLKNPMIWYMLKQQHQIS